MVNSKVSFGEFCDVWLGHYAKVSGVKGSTVDSRRKAIKRLKKYFDAIQINNITTFMYQEALINMKEQEENADNTIISTHSVAQMIFRRAIELEVIKTDPTEFASVPKEVLTVDDLENKVELPGYLEKEELALFLNTALKHGLDGDYETFLTLAYTGMRIGEFIPLRESDIDFAENIISITKTYYSPNNNMLKYELHTPKTKTSVRVIDVDPMITTVLKSYIHKNKEFMMLHRDRYYSKGYIMANKHKHPGYPMTLLHYQTRMKRLLKIAGLNENLTPHSLRHTHTSLLAEAGANLHDIMDRLGHVDDSTTKSVYLHVTRTVKKDTSKKFGDLLKTVENQNFVIKM
ncbi:site-specific integrase [Paenibacillus sp. 1011MAR3C5]|uniref:tyrosine-type recombinase/integrase n=1 Tax=Paenibacillus sp. 1011MAR3C5 TaxID=1675787 RepID=UPI00217618AB|nr:site-specific integrase [Paenibacillus sp. 1011MAR3C5]